MSDDATPHALVLYTNHASAVLERGPLPKASVVDALWVQAREHAATNSALGRLADALSDYAQQAEHEHRWEAAAAYRRAASLAAGFTVTPRKKATP